MESSETKFSTKKNTKPKSDAELTTSLFCFYMYILFNDDHLADFHLQVDYRLQVGYHLLLNLRGKHCYRR